MERESDSTISPKTKEMEVGGKKSENSSLWGESVVASNPSGKSPIIPTDCRFRDSLGTCLMVFALPLLIPGVTLTAVAFQDETGFSKYSVLHVLGMVMLAAAGLFIVVAVALLVRNNHKIEPEYQNDNSPQISTNDSSVIQSRDCLESYHDRRSSSSIVTMSPTNTITATTFDPTDSPNTVINTTAAPSVPIPPSKIPLNFMIETGQGYNPDQPPPSAIPKSSTVGSFPPINALKTDLTSRLLGQGQGNSRDGVDGYVSSSYDEYSSDMDSTDRSSGSYIISVENEAFQGSDEDDVTYKENYLPSKSIDSSKSGSFKKSIPRSKLTLDIPKSRNFFFEDSTTPIPENTKHKRLNRIASITIQPRPPIRAIEQTREEILAQTCVSPSPFTERQSRFDYSVETPVQQIPKQLAPTKNIRSIQGSPRQRLEAISNVSALAASMHMKNNEELLPENIAGEMSESNGSVFTGEDVEAVLEEELSKHTKRLSADDVIHRRHVPPQKRAFSSEVNTEDESIKTETSGITDASGIVKEDYHRKSEDYTSSPKVVSILRSVSAYDLPDPTTTQKEEDYSSISSDRLSSNVVTSALFSPTTTIFNFMNMTSSNNSSINSHSGGDNGGTVGGTPISPMAISQQRHLFEPVPLKDKKHATFNSKDGDHNISVTYYD